MNCIATARTIIIKWAVASDNKCSYQRLLAKLAVELSKQKTILAPGGL
jgi:hypothetical protein